MWIVFIVDVGQNFWLLATDIGLSRSVSRVLTNIKDGEPCNNS